MNARMISAEFLRLRRSRALVAWSLVLTSGAVALMYLVVQGFHWSDSLHNGPAGGVENLRRGLMVLSLVGGVGAAIVGTAVGTGDLSSGVFRDLVVTGKSRVALFAARTPGALCFWLPIVLAGYAVAIAFSFAFAGGLATPGAATIAKDGLWVLVVSAITLLVSIGVSSVIGSRGISIGVLLGWELAVTPLLLNISALGVTRESLLAAATRRIQPFHSDRVDVTMSLAAALVVLALWVVVPQAAGAWRTATRDA